ncbi:hypothetical protein QYF36_011127 [Acer negundo]|nr:hypothetical protein QYF36_011127 [Acer negundo]
MVEAVGRGWRDASGLLSKQTVETRILPSLNEKLNSLVLDGTQSQGDSRLVKKYGKITLSLIQRRDTFTQNIM